MRASALPTEKAQDLARLFEPSFATLRGLNLRDIVLRDNDSDWGSLLCHLATSEDILPALQVMKLSRLHTGIDGVVLLGGGDNHPVLHLGTRGSAGSWRADLVAHDYRFSVRAWGTSLDVVATGYPFIDIEA
jgi:hypothetical protein